MNWLLDNFCFGCFVRFLYKTAKSVMASATLQNSKFFMRLLVNKSIQRIPLVNQLSQKFTVTHNQQITNTSPINIGTFLKYTKNKIDSFAINSFYCSTLFQNPAIAQL